MVGKGVAGERVWPWLGPGRMPPCKVPLHGCDALLGTLHM